MMLHGGVIGRRINSHQRAEKSRAQGRGQGPGFPKTHVNEAVSYVEIGDWVGVSSRKAAQQDAALPCLAMGPSRGQS